jgi:four helix bundle protein
MRNYRDLQVWAKAHALTLDVYKKSQTFPKEEIYGLTAQLRRATSSIAANLAEGCGRQTDNELARFIRIALGSASEVDYHLLLCRDLGFLQNADYENTAKELTAVRKMLAALLSAVEKRSSAKAKSAVSAA